MATIPQRQPGELPSQFDLEQFRFWRQQFSPADRQKMLDEDRRTWRVVGAILVTIVTIGCALIAATVLLSA